mmetsp:Transcript_52516/g.97235  ORF Transcript_52516/g.97235 Transcript_52516/m.97235 type:complete len:242 (+) Transcript_52516:77-802(+)
MAHGSFADQQQTAVLDGHGWVIKSLLNGDECSNLMTDSASYGLVLKHYADTSGEENSGRKCFRGSFRDKSLAEKLQSRVEKLLPKEQSGWELDGVHDTFRLIHYEPGHYYGAHVDCSQMLPTLRNGRRRKTFYTLMVYLNEGFGGGDLVFHDLVPEWRQTPQAGLGILFLQDVDQLRHSGEAVTSGGKYILRGDVVYSVAHQPQAESEHEVYSSEEERLWGDDAFPCTAEQDPDSDSDFGP